MIGKTSTKGSKIEYASGNFANSSAASIRRYTSLTTKLLIVVYGITIDGSKPGSAALKLTRTDLWNQLSDRPWRSPKRTSTLPNADLPLAQRRDRSQQVQTGLQLP